MYEFLRKKGLESKMKNHLQENLLESTVLFFAFTAFLYLGQ